MPQYHVQPPSPSSLGNERMGNTDNFSFYPNNRDSMWSTSAHSSSPTSHSVSRSSSYGGPGGLDMFSTQPQYSTVTTPILGGAVGAVPLAYSNGIFPPGSVPMSPQSSSQNQNWMPAPMDLEAHLNKSPSFGPPSPGMRRDGIRKKNARFEIPAERTLSNIDQLIGQSTNEEEIKELKQQKRLLRNRQAALDSRQRKKLHTEKLEHEKRAYNTQIQDLQNDVERMRLEVATLQSEKNELVTTHGNMSQYIDQLHQDKEEMIRVHTLETSELRRKNNILRETVDKQEQGIKPAPDILPNQFPNSNSESWDDFSMLLPQESIGSAKNPEQALPVNWNAFYMCLLFGAFIASNSNTTAGSSLPQLSEEYRAESANVLKAVLASSPKDNFAYGSATDQPVTISGMEMAQISGSALDEMDAFVLPTEQQEREQVFSLNPNQYNSLTTFEDDGLKSQQGFDAMRNTVEQQSHVGLSLPSNTQSRSPLWGGVPEKVLRDFRHMVQDYTPYIKDERAIFG